MESGKMLKTANSDHIDYLVPTDPDEALNNIAVFEQAYTNYLNGGLSANNTYKINSEYALWVFEAALNKQFYASENEYRAEINTDSTSFMVPVTLDNTAEVGYIEGYDLLEQFEEVLTNAQDISYELAPIINVELESVDGDVILVKVLYAKKFPWGGYGPDPIGTGDNHYAKVKSKCDDTGNLNAADRLTTANRSIADIQAFMWYYTVRDYEISNNKQAQPSTRDIFDYRLRYQRKDPFGRIGWYHPMFTVASTHFDNRFLGGESVSGIPGADTYVPGDCVNSPELQGWDDDVNYVLNEVKKELDGIASVKIAADDQDPNDPTTLTHHNCKFRGANGGQSLEPSDVSSGNPILH